MDFLFLLRFYTGAQAGLKLLKQPRLASNLQDLSSLNLPKVRLTVKQPSAVQKVIIHQ